MQKGMDVRDRITTPAIHMPPRSRNSMHELQAKGEIGEDHVNLIFDQLDKNHDHHVSKAEFLERAADVFLAEQMQVQRMQAAMQSGAGQPMFIDGPGDCNQQ